MSSLKRPRSNPLLPPRDDVNVLVDLDSADGQLPDVDDLEVAAAAAAGVLEPAWVVQRVLGDPLPMPQPAPAPAPAPTSAEPVPPPTPQLLSPLATSCSVQLQVVGDTLSVQLVPVHEPTSHAGAQTDVLMVSDDDDSSDGGQEDTSSSSSDSDDGMTEAQYISSKAEITEMMAAAAEDADATDPKGMLPLERLCITIPDDVQLYPAGSLSSVVEGCLVVQGALGAAPLDIGSALCTADRVPLGRVEDIFGPVNAPLYVLRFSGDGEQPASLQPGVEVFAVPSMMQLVEQAALEGTWQGVGSDEEVEDDSDDDAEKEDVIPPVVKQPALAKRPRRGGRGRGRGGRGQPQVAFAGGAAFNAESLLAGYQQQFHWQGTPQPYVAQPPQPYVARPPQPYVAWQQGGPPPAWAPAPPNSLPPSYYRPQ